MFRIIDHVLLIRGVMYVSIPPVTMETLRVKFLYFACSSLGDARLLTDNMVITVIKAGLHHRAYLRCAANCSHGEHYYYTAFDIHGLVSCHQFSFFSNLSLCTEPFTQFNYLGGV